MNRHEPSRYVDESVCDYVVDLEGSDLELKDEYEVIYRSKFLDAEHTELSHRILYLPRYREWEWLDDKINIVYLDYLLLKKTGMATSEG